MSSTTTTSSECLLDTLVTWQDVESELQKSLKTNAKFGEKRKAECLGSMKGFMSRIALVEPDWIGKLPEDDLPDKFIVKVATELGIQEFFKVMAAVSDEPQPEQPPPASLEAAAQIQAMVEYHHNIEVETYKIITRDNNPKLQTTKIYASRAFSEASPVGFLVCEFVPNTRSITNYDTIPYERVVPVIDTAAAFSAMGERMSEEEKKGTVGVTFLEKRIRSFVPENTIPKVRKTLSEAVGQDFPTEKIDKLMSFITLFASNSTGVAENYSRIFEFLGHSPVLNHSDLWGGNMLFTKDSEDQLVFKALIDFQAPSLSSPGLDVAAISVTCLSSEDRKIHQEAVIERYYQVFKANLRESPVPYTFEQLHDSFELCFPLIAIQLMPIIWLMAKYEKREEALELARKKVTGLIEDLIVIQESNMNKFPKFFTKF